MHLSQAAAPHSGGDGCWLPILVLSHFIQIIYLFIRITIIRRPRIADLLGLFYFLPLFLGLVPSRDLCREKSDPE